MPSWEDSGTLLSGMCKLKKGREKMKRFLGVFISLCILTVCMAMPVLAEEYETSEFGNNGQTMLMLEVTVDENGENVYQTRNTDLAVITGGPWQNYVYPSIGDNVKVHVNITSISGKIYIYCKAGNASGTWDSSNLKATWTGTGHHWADLATGATSTKYYVMLMGNFTGSGAVYTEP